MQRTKSHLDVKREESSCKMAVKEPSNLRQKQNSETHNHMSPAGKVCPETKHECHEEERSLSCKNENEKASDMLMRKPSSDPGIPAKQSTSPLLRGSSKTPKDELASLRVTQSSDSGVKTAAVCGEGNSSVKRETIAGNLLPVQSFEGLPASQSDKERLTKSTQPEKALEKLQPRRNPDSGGCGSQSDQVIIASSVSEKLSIVPKAEPQHSPPRKCLDARDNALLSKEEKGTNVKVESVSQNLVQISSLSVGVPLPQPDQERYSYSTKFEKLEKLQPRRNPDPVFQESQSAEGHPSKVPEKRSDDGYNWRKYGQKLVKGNKFVRSYYKCTYPNCQAKKQVERTHDGSKTEVNNLGNHHHQKPQQNPQATSALQVRIPDMAIVSASKIDAEPNQPISDHGGANQHMAPTETSPQSTVARSADGVTGAVSCSNNDNTDKDDHPDSKRLKRDITSPDEQVVNKSNCDLRHVVQTMSEVDIINDGYRWRKYGQKLVKGNPNPRSYYRCSYAGCPVKKHVERASHDPKLVITTYEGKHDHDMPASRTVNQGIASGAANMMTPNGESSSKPEEKNPVSLEMVVHVSAN